MNYLRIRRELRYISGSVFQGILIIFLLTLLVREFYPDYVDHYISITYFMIVVIVLGAVAILTQREIEPVYKEPTLFEKILPIPLGIIGAVLVFLKLKEIGWIAYLIAGLAGLLIIFLSYMMFEEEEKY
jgi:hypothetical protein